jgi:hypothetical protein
MQAQRHILIVGRKDAPNLEGSYARAFEALGHAVSEFDLYDAIRDSIRFGAAGQALFRVAPREPWIVQGNRNLVVTARKLGCDTVVMAGSLPIRAGALAQLKASIPQCKVALLWPDPMLNLGSHIIQALPLLDCVASYSEAACPILDQLGARKTIWLCFAADPELHRADSISAADRAQYGCDISFVGNMRPERERAIRTLIKSGLDVKVWGERRWLTQVSDKQLARSYFRGGPLFGSAYYKAMRTAKVGLNVIDDTNYPAANMRFFEGLACGAAMLSSPCPELEQTFRDRESILYFKDDHELVERARELLHDDALRTSIARNGERLVLSQHTYRQRAETLLDALYSDRS